MEYLGEIAGLATALCWVFTSIFFAEAGRRIGSFKVNKIRLLMAVVIYAVVLLATTGRLLPALLNWEQVFWLGLSGVIGLVFGDGCGFKALVMIGPRLTTMLYSFAPIIAVMIAWFMVGEQLSPTNLLGIALTVIGIGWVVSERQYKNNNMAALSDDHPDRGTMLKGVLLGLGAALGQAAGLVLSKYGMLRAGGEVQPMEASFIRMFISLIVIWAISAARGQVKETVMAMRDRKAMLHSLGGAFFGPFLGVWMSLVAVKLISTGVAATLNAMTPVLIIPVVIFYYKEKISFRALLGALIAVFGVALLFWE